MKLRSVATADLAGKNVLIRVDFNVELDDLAHVQEGFKLEVARKTIDHVVSAGARSVALVTHFGRPDGTADPKYSVQRLAPEVMRVLGRIVRFVPECSGPVVTDAVATATLGEVLFLENVRFAAGETTNDPAFAAALAAPFDAYINEAFGVSHRAHASVVGVTAHLPSYAGFHLCEETERLDAVRFNPDRPALAIIGGAKIETKLPLIRALEATYDCVLVGGKIANEAIDQKIVFSDKVLLPQDFDSPARLDIGKTTASYYAEIIKKAKTIIWNGPMGKFEEKPYDVGTKIILDAILETDAYVIIGGGESLAVLEQAGVFHRISFVSSGGGAMLEYMAGNDLPGLLPLVAA
ncbi:MAG: phosphoglycerate kinase [Candidatus Moraniibacteriota bacterium]